MRRRSVVLRRYLISYFLILLIPIAFILLVFNEYFLNDVQARVEDSLVLEVERNLGLLEAEFRNMRRVAHQISQDAVFRPFVFADDPYHSREIGDAMQKYVRADNFYSFLGIWYRDGGFVYSTYEALRVDYFHDLFFASTNTLAQLKQTLSGLTEEAGLACDDGFVYAIPYPSTSRRKTGVLLFVVPAASIDTYTLRSNTVKLEILPTGFTEPAIMTTSRAAADDSSVAIIDRRSEYFDWRYRAVLSMESVQLEIARHKALFLVALALMCGLSIVFVFVFSYLNYRPVRNLHRFFSELARVPEDDPDEFKAIESFGSDLVSYKVNLELELRHAEPQLEEYRLLKLIDGQFVSDDDKAGMHLLRYDKIVVIAVHDDANGDREHADEAFETGALVTVLPGLSNEKEVLVVGLDLKTQERRWIDDLSEQLRRTGANVRLGVSRTKSNLDELAGAYREAVVALGQTMFTGNSVCHYTDAIADSRMGGGYPYERVHQFRYALHTYDIGAAREALRDLAAVLRTDEQGFFDACRLYFNIVNVIADFAHEQVAGEEEQLLGQLLAVDTTGSVEDRLVQMVANCESLGETLHRTWGDIPDHVVSTVKYITENYADPNMSVKLLAARCNLTPAYLSVSYKKHAGENISTTLQSARHRRIKELLRETDLPMSRILVMCGYRDPASYMRKFKRIEGVTPGEYRRRSQASVSGLSAADGVAGSTPEEHRLLSSRK